MGQRFTEPPGDVETTLQKLRDHDENHMFDAGVDLLGSMVVQIHGKD